jgi:pyruvate kinase
LFGYSLGARQSLREDPSMPTERVGRFQTKARTKIVATVGPACEGPERLAELVLAGVDVFRLNTAHGDVGEHTSRVAAIREVSQRLNRPIGILVDLGGPKIRLGDLPGDMLDCTLGAEFRFVRGHHCQAANELATTYSPLVDELQPGNRVMLADGTVVMQVVAREPNAAVCTVVQPGIVRSRQGVNLPGVKLSTPALTDVDRSYAAWAADVEADFLGLSFVRDANDVLELKNLLKAAGGHCQVIAKIEKPEALEQLTAIVQAADGLMIARGDLGVEIDVARVPVVQKQIIALANAYQKPVITATQMLDSMHHSPRPTRAEASDVANAIFDGTDACMLSGETAIGDYPRQAVEMMNRIALVTEEASVHVEHGIARPTMHAAGLHQISAAVVSGASVMSQQLGAKLIVAVSQTGATALALSKQRNFVPTIGVSMEDATLRRMCLYWGVNPIPGEQVKSRSELIVQIVAWGKAEGLLASKDRIILVTGTHAAGAGHNQVLVHEVA